MVGQSWGLLRPGDHSSVGLIAGSPFGVAPAAKPGPEAPRSMASAAPPSQPGLARPPAPAGGARGGSHRPRHGAQARQGRTLLSWPAAEPGGAWRSPLGDRPAPPAAAAAAGPGLPPPGAPATCEGPAPPKASAPGVGTFRGGVSGMPTGSAETAMHSDGEGTDRTDSLSPRSEVPESFSAAFFFPLFFLARNCVPRNSGSPAENAGLNWSLLQAQAPPPEGPVPRGGDCNTSLMLKGPPYVLSPGALHSGSPRNRPGGWFPNSRGNHAPEDWVRMPRGWRGSFSVKSLAEPKPSGHCSSCRPFVSLHYSSANANVEVFISFSPLK